MSFQLSSEVDKNKIFLVNRSNMEERFDCEYYNPSIVERINAIKQKTHVKLGEKLKRIQTGYNNLQNVCSGFPFIRTQNVRPIWLDLEKTSFTTDMKVRKSKVGDLLFTRIGVNVGDVGFNATGDFAISDNVILARINNSDFAKFVAIFLSTELGAVFIEREKRDTARAIISYGNIKKILIPALSNTNQRKVNAKMDAAYAAKKKKEADAQALLDSIDDYLLGELGITLPVQQENTIQSRIFTRPLSEVSGGRFDAIFYSPPYTNITNSIKETPHEKLGHIVRFSSEAWDQKIIFTNTFPYIEIGEIDLVLGEVKNINQVSISEAPSRAKMIVRSGDIIISTTRPNRGAIVKIGGANEVFVASTGFSVIREVLRDDVDPLYLYYMLRQPISLKQMEQRSSGGNYPAITQEELSQIIISIPSIKKQKEITHHITQIRQQAKQLQQEAKAGLVQAKKEVEAMILGEGE